ncbi:MAG TPA: universal stress protein [Hyphomicrobiaceae bacterium]|nr:universal stress protein [Hyphomicrobiaceae bacterium]
MYKHILIATDGSELAQKAVAQGLELAKRLGAKATAVVVTEPWDALSMAAMAEQRIPNPVADYEERMAAYANRVLWSVSEAAKKQDQPCLTLYVKDRYPAEGILEAAKSQGCDLIVMASHGRRGLSKLFLGSQAAKVVTLSPVPVLVCR